jgi:hypothetical protein
MKITKFDPNYPWHLGDTTLSQGGGVEVVTGDSGSTGGSGTPVGPAAGDLSGAYPSPTVVGIQGTPVDALPAIATEYLNGDGHWTTPAGGGGGGGALVLLEQHTASSSAELDFTTAITSTYDEYMIEVLHLVPATNGVSIGLQFSTDGGSTYDSTSGHYASQAWRWIASAAGAGGSTSTTGIGIDGGGGVDSVSNAASQGGLSGTYRLFDPGSSSIYKHLVGSTTFYNSGSAQYDAAALGGQYLQTTAVNAFRIYATSGNLASGTVRVYGIAKV